MKEHDHINSHGRVQDNIIDKFYNEGYDKKLYESCKDADFEAKLEGMNEALEILEQEIPAVNSFFDIIEKADVINTKARYRKENALFFVLAGAILSLFGYLAASIGESFIIGFSIFTFAILPFSLLPLSKAALTGGKNNG